MKDSRRPSSRSAEKRARTSSGRIYHLVTPEEVAAARAAGLLVIPWTANTPADWDRLIAAKVDAIISDDPAALIAHLRRAQ